MCKVRLWESVWDMVSVWVCWYGSCGALYPETLLTVNFVEISCVIVLDSHKKLFKILGGVAWAQWVCSMCFKSANFLRLLLL